ncbi:TonB-dependent receptor [Novosphingobium sp.]|uniref:TonB-dependent siderophore receptor n=1 Tax=Novosphingobium sp. TaxID=1874826 RepID=UPI0031CE8641
MRTSRSTLRIQLFCATAAIAAASIPACAQAADEPATESRDDTTSITVTGMRQPYLGTTPLKQLPQVVQTMDAKILQDAGLTTLSGALDFVAGVARQNNFGGLFDSYAIRGFAGDESQSSNYLLNGFSASRGYGGARDASNIERIEVIKGPTSALFGRGDPGGAVNIITKKPYFTNGGELQLSGGSYNNRRVQGDVNVALTSKFAARITGAYDEGDSYRQYMHHKTYTISPSFLWQLNDATKLSYDFEWVHQQVPFDRGIVAVNGNLYAIPRTRFLGEPGDGPITTESFSHQLQMQHSFSKNWTVLLGASYRTSSFSGYATEAENTTSRQRFYTDSTNLSRQRRYRDYNTTDLTFRGEVDGKAETFGLTHNLQIGADWNYFTLDTIQTRFRPPAVAAQTTLAAGNAINIYNPVYGNLPTTGAFINSIEKDEEGGAYLQDMIDVTDWLKLRAGGRYDHFDQIVLNRLTTAWSRQTRDAFSPQLGLSILPTQSLTLYGSFGKGFRPNIGTDANNNAFLPEKTTAWEVGGKLSAFHNALLASLALYTMTKTNVLTADPVNAGFSIAAGKARSRGVEASVSGKLPYGFRVDLNYAYTDAIIDQDAIDPNFGYSLHKGDQLINVPKNSASALLFKDFTLAGKKADIGAGINYVGQRVGETGYRNASGAMFMLPSYTLTRVSASLSLTEKLKLSGEVTNLFNVSYFPSSYSRIWLMPGAPRQFMVHLAYKM